MFATLRFTHIRRRLARTLEAESGGNDPMAIALTLGLIAWIEHPDDYGIANLALLVVQQIGLGLVVGVVLGAAGDAGLRAPARRRSARSRPSPRWPRPRSRSGRADVIGGSGFLAVYLVGLAVGSTPSRYRRQLVAFHEGIAFLAQVTLFIVLGLLVFPQRAAAVASPGLALALAARPGRAAGRRLGVDGLQRLHAQPSGCCSAGRACAGRCRSCSRRSRSRRTSRTPTRSSTPSSSSCVVSTILQGWTLEWLAGRLGLLSPAPRTREAPLEVGERSELDLIDFVVAPDHAIAGSAVRELGLPRSAIVAVVERGRDSIPPRGSTVIQPGDRLFVLAPRAMRPDVEDVFSRWRRRV